MDPANQDEADMAPDAEDPSIKVPTMMTTADMAMIRDPEYRKISKHFHENPDVFADAFQRAWFKLLHRDMGPKARYLGPDVPDEDFIWQDPVSRKHLLRRWCAQRTPSRAAASPSLKWLKRPGPAPPPSVAPTTAAAPTAPAFALHRRRIGKATSPTNSPRCSACSNPSAESHGASVADTIVLAGCAAIEMASGVEVPFSPGRGDATQEQTDAASFSYLEPVACGFRNYLKQNYAVMPEEMMLDKAQFSACPLRDDRSGRRHARHGREPGRARLGAIGLPRTRPFPGRCST